MRGPEQIHGVQSADAYRSLALAVGQQTRQFVVLRTAGSTPAFVNVGRWLVRCICGNAPCASVEWSLAVCLDCGLEYAPTFPDTDERLRIEAALVQRPERNQHWLPGETAEALWAQNREHGLVAPEEVPA